MEPALYPCGIESDSLLSFLEDLAMRLGSLSLLWLLAACQTESKVASLDTEDGAADTDTTEQPAEDPAPSYEIVQVNPDAQVPTDTPDDYIYDEETVEPSLNLDDVELGIEEGLAAAMWVDPGELHTTYAAIVDPSMDAVVSEEDDCPYYYDYYLEDYGYFYWYDSCTANDDTYFTGYALSYDYTGLNSYPYQYGNYAYLSGSGSVTDSAGYTLDIGGYSYINEYDYYDYYSYHYGYTYGNFSYDDPNSADSWLAAGLSVNLYWYAYHYDNAEGPQNYVTVTGSLAGMEGNVNTIVLTDTYIYTETAGSECAKEPSGTISVRDDEGEWYDVNFQGPPYQGASVLPSDCDGCGQVYFRGELLGEVCPDFSILTDWEDRPW